LGKKGKSNIALEEGREKGHEVMKRKPQSSVRDREGEGALGKKSHARLREKRSAEDSNLFS